VLCLFSERISQKGQSHGILGYDGTERMTGVNVQAAKADRNQDGLDEFGGEINLNGAII